MHKKHITLWANRLHQFGHVFCSKGWIKKCTQYEVTDKGECGQARKTWQQCVNCDLKFLKLSKDLTSNCKVSRDTLSMVKSPTQKKCGIWAQSR